jgi:hypothetical protein
VHARTTTVQVQPSSIDAQVAHVRDDVMPVLLATDGCIGLSMLVNRVSGRCIATSAWQSEKAMHATEDDRVVAVDGDESVVGTPEVEEWEIAVLHRDHSSAPGAWVRTTWLHVEPDQTDRLADLHRTVLLPQIMGFEGFCSESLLIDRPSGHAVSSVTFDSYEAMRSTSSLAALVRRHGAADVDGEILEVDQLELALAHLRVPETV